MKLAHVRACERAHAHSSVTRSSLTTSHMCGRAWWGMRRPVIPYSRRSLRCVHSFLCLFWCLSYLHLCDALFPRLARGTLKRKRRKQRAFAVLVQTCLREHFCLDGAHNAFVRNIERACICVPVHGPMGLGLFRPHPGQWPGFFRFTRRWRRKVYTAFLLESYMCT